MSPNQASGASGLTPWRIDAWTAAATQEFDLVVVGGGITGAGIARDATLRGLRVALFEKADFANGTSGRSSRLVHGGLRYLEHGHLRLVREASRERRTLLRIAPHLVRPLAFTWPLYEGARIPQWKLRAGLALYDALAFYRNVSPHRRLTPEEVRAVEPKLLAAGLRGGVRYFDAGADDARLVLANAIAAAEQGAVVLNYASVELVRRVTTPGRSAWIVEVRDALNGAAAQCRTRAVVMALGPWSGDAPALAGEAVPSGQIVPSAGAHIALPRRLVGNAGALTLLSPVDDRVMFVLGDGDLTIVTTTESPTGAPADDVRASAADVRYLLAAVTHYFPGTDLGPADVVAAWAGVRPLTLSSPNVKHPLTAVSREHAISEVDSRLIVVTGGKLTTYRSMAEEVVDRVAAALGRRVRRAVTDRVPLPGGELSDVRAAISAAERTTGERDMAERLIGAHGARWPLVWRLAADEPALRERLTADAPYIAAEVVYAMVHERALMLADVLIRRIPLAFTAADHGMSAAQRVVELLAARLGWARDSTRQALEDYEAAVARLFRIEDGAAPAADSSRSMESDPTGL